MVQFSIPGLLPEIKKQKQKCAHCGRWVANYHVVNGKLYGSTCVKIIRKAGV